MTSPPNRAKRVSGVVRKAGVVTLGKSRGDKVVEHPGGGCQRERARGLAADGQVAASAANGEGDDEAIRAGFDSGMVFTSEGSLAEIEGGGANGGWFRIHGGLVG